MSDILLSYMLVFTSIIYSLFCVEIYMLFGVKIYSLFCMKIYMLSGVREIR